MQMRATFWLVLLWTAALAALTVGCIRLEGFERSTPTIQYYTLDYPSPPSLSPNPVAGPLRLKRFDATDAYATDRIVYTEAGSSTRFYHYQRWTVSPAAMVTRLMARDLMVSGLFRAVVRSQVDLHPEYILTGTLESLQALQTDAGLETEVAITVLFYPAGKSREEENNEIFQKRYVVTTPCGDKKPESIVRSMNEGMEKLSREMLQDLAARLRPGTDARTGARGSGASTAVQGPSSE
ncbi:MAG: ABC-type transport auxiliary lipoprotein family protein [bacterium]